MLKKIFKQYKENSPKMFVITDYPKANLFNNW